MKRTKIMASIITLLLVGAVGAACSNTPNRTGTAATTTAEELTEASTEAKIETEAATEAEIETEASTEAKKETETATEVASNTIGETKTGVEISDTDRVVFNITSNDEDEVQLIEVEFPDGADKVSFTSDAKIEKNDEEGVYSVYLNGTDDNEGVVEFHLDTKTAADGEKNVRIETGKNQKEESTTEEK